MPYYCWRPIPSTFWQRLPTHADLFYYMYQQPDTHSCCQHNLQRRHLLCMSISVPSASHSPRHGKRFHVPTSIRFIARKRQGHIHTLLINSTCIFCKGYLAFSPWPISKHEHHSILTFTVLIIKVLLDNGCNDVSWVE